MQFAGNQAKFSFDGVCDRWSRANSRITTASFKKNHKNIITLAVSPCCAAAAHRDPDQKNSRAWNIDPGAARGVQQCRTGRGRDDWTSTTAVTPLKSASTSPI
jgi:hypothetical protein